MRALLWVLTSVWLVAACDSAAVAPPGGRAAPRRLSATPDEKTTAIRLRWAAAPGAEGYRIYRSVRGFELAPGSKSAWAPAGLPWGTFKPLTVLSGPDVSENAYYDTDVSAETVYFYRVTALAAGGESAPSNLASAMPARFNRPPAPTARAIETAKNAQASTQIHANDPNRNDAHSFTVTAAPAHGVVEVTAYGLAVYAPDLQYDGADSFTVRVADAFGGAGEVRVAVNVLNHAPAPGDAALNTFKNTPVGYLVNPHDPDPSEIFTLDVTTPPAHGSVAVAGNLITYTPVTEYTGRDVFALRLADSSGEARGFSLDVQVTNRSPAPIVATLYTELNTPGVTQVLGQDPDPGEVLTYSMVTGPTRGAASLAADGLVSYTPDVGYMGGDSLAVRVEDLSGAVAYVVVPVVVDQTHLPPGASFAMPPEVCSDGWSRVLISDIQPPAFSNFMAGANVPFTITLSYSTPVTQTIGASLGGYGNAVTSVEPGCGTVTLSAMAWDVLAPFWVEPAPNLSRTAVQYGVAAPAAARAAFTTVALPRDSFIRTPTFEFDARIAFDLAGEAGAWSSPVDIEQLGGVSGFRARFYPALSPVGGMPVRLRGALGCDDTFATYQLRARPADSSSTWAYAYLAFPAAPPAVRVDNFLTGLPVTSSSVTQLVNLRPCAGATAVTFTTSAPWFSVAPTLATLSAFLDTPVAVTVDGGAIGTYATQVTGTVWVWPFEGTPFAPVPIEVSAVRLSIDLADYTRVGLTGSDDGAALVALPWAFPFRGRSVSHVEVTANGTVNVTDTPCMHDWRNVVGPFQHLDPGRYGCAFLAPLWADHAFANAYAPGQSIPDVYVREAPGGDRSFEILFWDMRSRERFYSHNVILVRLFPDGRFTFEYIRLDALGHESVGWWGADGTSGPLTFAGSLASGNVLDFAAP